MAMGHTIHNVEVEVRVRLRSLDLGDLKRKIGSPRVGADGLHLDHRRRAVDVRWVARVAPLVDRDTARCSLQVQDPQHCCRLDHRGYLTAARR